MSERKANAVWNGTLKDGNGIIGVESGFFKDAPYTFKSRFEQGDGTNPEELIGAAHAGCFSMALSGMLEENGYKPQKISTEATVRIEKVGDGFEITNINLSTEVKVSGINEKELNKIADEAKSNCPVSKALAATSIELDAKLL